MIKPIITALLITFTLLSAACFAHQHNEPATVEGIKNYQSVSDNFSTAGLPSEHQLAALKEDGFGHVINLIPGDYAQHEARVKALGMSYAQIPVDWQQPTLADFQNFVALMARYDNEKVLLHCKLNYRASAFAYLYQVTQLGISSDQARAVMADIWQPTGTWATFIEQVKAHYQKEQ